jgi:RNA polymerase sigma factor for flagellar operon FliA
VSAGILGLVDAATKFDEEKNIEFKAYAEWRIKGAILDDLRSRDFISRQQRQKYKKYEQEKLILQNEMGRSVTIDELAQKLDIPAEEIERTYYHATSSHHSEINESVKYTTNDENMDHREVFDSGVGHSPLKKLFYKEMREEIANVINSLPERNQLIMSLYYQDNMSFKEIGLILDLTESRVSQLHKQSIKILREKLDV